MKVKLPVIIWKLHKDDPQWICQSIEKGLYSVDVKHLLLVVKTHIVRFAKDGITKELDLDACEFTILVNTNEELKRMQERYNLNDQEMSNLVACLAMFGFMMGEV